MSEPTPDGLALTFEFVRSKKGSFYEENVTLRPKVSIFHLFLKAFRKKCACVCNRWLKGENKVRHISLGRALESIVGGDTKMGD